MRQKLYYVPKDAYILIYSIYIYEDYFVPFGAFFRSVFAVSL